MLKFLDNNKRNIIWVGVVLVLFFFLLDVNYHYRPYYDVLRATDNYLVQDNMSDYYKVVTLLNYSSNNVAGLCSEKSSMFERLASIEGFKTEHIVMVYPDNSTHAISRVMVNDSWLYVDSLENKVTNLSYYCNLSGCPIFRRHINCINKMCSNYDLLELYFLGIFYIKDVSLEGSNG